ncbi:hypothetical protein KIPB_003748, partial [Kipferlia bialata]|eukprot:g3748.t1
MVGDVPSLGLDGSPIQMQYNEESTVTVDQWSATVDLPTDRDVSYSYFVKRLEGGVEGEAGAKKVVNVPSGYPSVLVQDEWQAVPCVEKAVVDCEILRSGIEIRRPRTLAVPLPLPTSPGDVLVRFCVSVPCVRANHEVRVVGNCPELGDWNTNGGLTLANAACHLYSGWVRCSGVERQNLEYKYTLVHKWGESVDITWESENRVSELDMSVAGVFYLTASNGFQYPVEEGYLATGVHVPLLTVELDDRLSVRTKGVYDREEINAWTATRCFKDLMWSSSCINIHQEAALNTPSETGVQTKTLETDNGAGQQPLSVRSRCLRTLEDYVSLHDDGVDVGTLPSECKALLCLLESAKLDPTHAVDRERWVLQLLSHTSLDGIVQGMRQRDAAYAARLTEVLSEHTPDEALVQNTVGQIVSSA